MKFFLAIVSISIIFVFGCGNKDDIFPVDVIIKLSDQNGGTRSYLDSIQNNSEKGVYESRENGLTSYKINLRYKIISSSINVVKINIDLRLVKEGFSDQKWNETLIFPSDYSIDFQPIKDINLKIVSSKKIKK